MEAAIFVDAGYFFAQGTYALVGETRKRADVELDIATFAPALTTYVETNLPHGCGVLRTYWYDGARDGVCSAAQLQIGAQSHVKLRVGRLNGRGQQKGVDTLIVRDLMVLSQERSIKYAVVLSGDEDLREGIEYAQDRGVVVHVLGIRGAQGTSQSAELVREADHALELPHAQLSALTIRETLFTTESDVDSEEPADPSEVTEAARAFAAAWSSKSSPEALEAARTRAPHLSPAIDAQLLRAVEKAVGASLRGNQRARKQARRVFVEAIGAESDLS